MLTTTSALGIALLAPLAAQSARQPGDVVPSFLLDVAPATSTLDRGSPGRERMALLTLLEQTRPVAPETLSSQPRALPTPGSAEMQATLLVRPAAQPAITSAPPPPLTGDEVSGLATWYCCSAGWRGEAVVALPGALGGQYDPPPAARNVTICADRCASLPVVDYCDCYWGTSSQKVADLSPEAWALISDASTGAGVIQVTVHLD
ncbi:MAG TPA: hypothetical protein VFH90_02310 [Candidatus Limnocylindria bacterium]|nr:hypothetical protein [Candidatus Limnocylindria bacterium]